MRLLQCGNNGEFSLTEFTENNIPRYGILSHRWGAEEVTYNDLLDGTGKSKAGHRKIQLCGEQAKRDGLQYFWVDTCCINKSDAVEYQTAINSMFRWYRDAAKCYVYLRDVSRPRSLLGDNSNESWESSFRKSEWFKRGWTLQELIAPASVEFFSKDWELLGNKVSLEWHICEVTGIPARALRGSPLSDFTVVERFSWTESRVTTYPEDKAYSLLGIFDIFMPLLYGEGKARASERLREEIDKASRGSKCEDFSVTFSLYDTPEVENFVAREDELSEIHRELKGDGSRRVVVLHGLGGIGKTQLSIAYAKRHKNNYSAIFWLNINDEDSLKQSFAKLAKQISRKYPSAIPRSNQETTNDNLDEVVESVKAWLSLPNNTRWLMIYDNYDNPKLPGKTNPIVVDIRKFLPESYQGSVIITTRSSEVRLGYLMQIQKLKNIRDSLEILLTVSRRQELNTDPDAMKLAKELDGLPLALATAGAYLDQTARSFSDYLRLYKESWARLEETSPMLSTYDDRTFYSTWQISFDNIKQRNPLSVNLLRLWAYFDNQDLWLELLQYSKINQPEWLRELTKDEASFDCAVRLLISHGLVEVATFPQGSTESRGYSIHGCVHSWTIHALNQKWDYDAARLAVKSVAAHVPETGDNRSRIMQRRLLQHAARCSYLFSNSLVRDDDLADHCRQLGYLYDEQGKLTEAENMYKRALRGYEKASGAADDTMLGTFNNLGIIYRIQGKFIEAEQMYQRALQGKEKAFGQEHPSTLDTVNNLGVLYAAQGKLVEAEQMHQRALQGKEKAFGQEHPSTLGTVNNLGVLYEAQGKLVEAKQMYQRVLQGYEKAWGPEHPSTLGTISNLGRFYRDKGKLVEAEQMLQRALQGYQKVIGPDLSSTYVPALHTTFNLAVLAQIQADLGTARTMYLKALRGCEQVYGPDHAKTEDVRNRLCALDVMLENEAVVETEERLEEVATAPGPGMNEPPSTSKRYKLLRKLGLRPRT
ncbi:hypothetical protein BKA64DRAFT_638282 [Cadophora sp. MPI-SDFR-AT-0126]|nr:hypothetical protein BKA64DRAFT_638282 [Leotiomycetes sp. MPI-SDFR-AT-0126]